MLFVVASDLLQSGMQIIPRLLPALSSDWSIMYNLACDAIVYTVCDVWCLFQCDAPFIDLELLMLFIISMRRCLMGLQLAGFHGDVENKESSRWYVASESRATLFLFHSRFITVFTLKSRPHRAAYFIARLSHFSLCPCVTPPLYCLSICIDRSLPWMDSSGEHSLPRIDRIRAALRLFVCCAVLVIECIALPHSEA